MKPIILASTSPYRRSQLEQLGLSFTTHAPTINEDLFKRQGLSAKNLTSLLSLKKAESLAHLFPNSLIIGGDQVAEIDGDFLDKPGNKQAAIKQLQRLQGRSHHLWSGVAVHDTSQRYTEFAVEKHILKMRELSDKQIHRYLDLDEPWFCAGSYRIESKGISLFSSIEGHDHTAIIGLPLLLLVGFLHKFGIPLP